MPADELDYEGVPYGDLVFEDIDWSEVGRSTIQRAGLNGRAPANERGYRVGHRGLPGRAPVGALCGKQDRG